MGKTLFFGWLRQVFFQVTHPGPLQQRERLQQWQQGGLSAPALDERDRGEDQEHVGLSRGGHFGVTEGPGHPGRLSVN